MIARVKWVDELNRNCILSKSMCKTQSAIETPLTRLGFKVLTQECGFRLINICASIFNHLEINIWPTLRPTSKTLYRLVITTAYV